jgi:hypothetical protein
MVEAIDWQYEKTRKLTTAISIDSLIINYKLISFESRDEKKLDII